MADRKKSEGPEYINICQNRKASFEYELEERLECGIMLRGSEVKSLRTGQANLDGAYARILKRGDLALRLRYPRIYDGQPVKSRTQAGA